MSYKNVKTLTLHADGTSKFGQDYGSFQISTNSTAYSLGLSQMLIGLFIKFSDYTILQY